MFHEKIGRGASGTAKAFHIIGLFDLKVPTGYVTETTGNAGRPLKVNGHTGPYGLKGWRVASQETCI